MKTIALLVDYSEEGERIDRYLARQHPALSRSYIQKIIAEKGVLVNDTPV